jgi:hypothetical protein
MATYNVPASDWTRAIDAALDDWSRYIVGSPNFTVNLKADPSINYLAKASSSPIYVGKENGEKVYVMGAQSRYQGIDGPGDDFNITVNPNFPWAMSGNPSGSQYDAQSVMRHELGHGLFMLDPSYGTTPFEKYRDANPGGFASDGIHTTGGLMLDHAYPGDTQQVTEADARMAGKSGLPTIFDDNIYLLNGAKIDAGSGNDTGVWLDTFDNYNADLTNFERLEMRGANPLTAPQQDIYKLYKAGLNRVPDLGGFKYWKDSGQDLNQMASGFLGAPEFAPTANIADRGDYISALYTNILGRAPEQAGLDYWNSRSDLDKGGLLANIAVAPENEIGTASFLL